MVDVMQNLHTVYSKWENRSKNKAPGSSGYKPRIIAGVRDPRYDRNNRRFHNRPKKQEEMPPTDLMKARYKFVPTAVVPMAMPRPMVGLCCTCLPHSQKTLCDKVSEAMGLRNMLLVDTQGPKNGWLTQKFCYVAYALQKNPKIVYQDIGKRVLEDERVSNAMNQSVEEEVKDQVLDEGMDTFKRLYQKQLERTSKILSNMKAATSTFMLRIASWLLHTVLCRLHNSIVISKGQVEMLRRASTSEQPIIYMPLHRSHLDYLLISLILYNEELRVPLVAAGNNLQIPLFGPVLRGLGAFYIKRKLDYDGKRDLVYRAVLHSYIQECLKAGHHLEIFIEGSRTRSGKPCRPKGGLLSVICDAYTSGIIDDAYVVPVAITYDRQLEGNFIGEQLGEPKRAETFLGAVRSIWRVLSSRYGSVRVNFGQPFSLKEYVDIYQRTVASGGGMEISTGVNGFCRVEPQVGEQNPRIGLHLALSNSSLYGAELLEEEQRHLVENLARHIICDASRCISVMATSAISFLLLNKFRSGVSLPKLALELDKLRAELADKKVDVGFSGHAVDVVNYAVSLLGPGLVRRDREGTDDLITPVTLLPNVIELAYYANTAILPFTMDAIVATAIYYHLGDDLVRYRGTPDMENSGSKDAMVSLKVKRGELVRTCLELCSILQFEFMVVQPCVPLDSLFNAVVEKFITAGMLKLLKMPNHVVRGRRFEWDSDSSDEEEEWHDPQLQVELKEDTVDRLLFLHQLLCPVLDTYYWSLCSLDELVGRESEERDLHLDILAYIKRVQEKGLAPYGETLSMESVRNCLKLLEQWHIVDVYCHEGMRVVYLNESYDVEDGLQPLIEKWQHFRK